MRPSGMTALIICLIGAIVLGGIYLSTRGRDSGANVSATATAFVISQQRIGTTVAAAPSATPLTQQVVAQQPQLIQCLDGVARTVCPTVAPTNTSVPVAPNTAVPQQAQVIPALQTQLSTSATQNPPAVPQNTGLPVSEVKGWCSGAGCGVGLFEQVNEGGMINPNAVHFKINALNLASTFAIPAGVSATIWNCYAASNVHGPTTVNQVCEATFRR